MRTLIFIASILSLTLGSCCKEKQTCKGKTFQIQPFIERYSKFECQTYNEYTFVFNTKKQIEGLEPNCSFNSGIGFPIDESNMRYFIVGRFSYHDKDTFQTYLWKDTCLKTLTYEVDMIQRDEKYSFPDSIGAIQSMFCAVENVPADYKVEVKYKYVPLP